MSKTNVPVFFSCDDNYIPFLGVAIKSLIENSSKENNYFVFVLHSKMSIKNMKIITATVKSLISVIIIPCLSTSEYLFPVCSPNLKRLSILMLIW